MRRLLCAAAIVATAAFSTVGASDNYQSWAYYRNIVLNTKASGANVGTSGSPVMTHFPVLVSLSGHVSNGGNANDSMVMAQSAFSSTNGADIRFSKWDGTHCYFQRQRWDAANMYAEFWVLVDTVWGQDSVNSTNYPNGYLKMYWGNTAAGDSTNGKSVFDTTAGSSLWGGGYQAVYHMTGATNIPDSDATKNGLYATPMGGGPHDTIGMIGRSKWFNRSSLYDTVKNSTTGKLNFLAGTNYTLCGWVCPDSFPGPCDCNDTAYCSIISKCDKQYNLQMGDSTNGTTRYGLPEAAEYRNGWFTCRQILVRQAHTWHYVVGRYASGNSVDTVTSFVDGVANTPALANGTNTQTTTYGVCLGKQPGSSSPTYRIWHGMLNELELANVARSPNWIRLSYENQHQINASGATTLGTGLDSLTKRGPALSVNAPPALASYSANPATYVTLMPITPNAPAVSGTAPYTFTASPALPAGLSINTSTGIITGAASSSSAQQTYTVTVQNSYGSASIGLTITVNNAPPAITGQPASVTVVEGANAKFTLTVSGTPPMNYTWKDNNNNTVKNDTTMNISDTLTIPNDSAKNYGSSYTCTITNSMGSAGPSTAAFLYVAIAPTLVSPANNAFGITQSPTLSWNSVTGATMYYLQVSTSTAFGVNALNDSSATLSKVEALSLGTLYYWRVQSKCNGMLSLWSNSSGSPWQFTTVSAAPALSTPVNTAVEVAVSPTLTWNTVTQVTKYWIQITTDGTFTNIGTSDSTNPTPGGTYSASLNNGTTYYWRVAATSGGGAWGAWSAPWSFYTTENYASWPGTRVIGFNTRGAAPGSMTGAGVATTQRNFPVLVRLTASDFSAMSPSPQNNGSDIRFTNANGVHLYYQIDTFNVSANVGTVWVLADSVTGNTANQYINMLYGNSTAGLRSISKGSKVFDTANGFQGVWHMNGPTGSSDSDATLNGFYSIPKGGGPHDTLGIIGRSKWFDRVALYDSIANSVTGKLNLVAGTNYTLSAWICPDSFPGPGADNDTSYNSIISKGDKQYNLQMADSTNGTTRYGVPEAAEYRNGWFTCRKILIMKAHQWHHVAGRYASTGTYDTVTSFVDGVANVPSVASGTNTQTLTFGVCIGREPGETTSPYRIWKGMIDEAEVANVARSADWINLCYQNQQANQTLTYTTAPTSATYRSSTLNLTTTAAMTPDTPVTVTGVVAQYSVSPPLPSGLSLNSVTGIFSGTPSTAAGATAYVVTAGNPIGSVTTGVTISVVAPPAGFTYATNPATYLLNAPIAEDSALITNSVDSFTVSGTLPAGLSLNKVTGAITGTPTATQSAAAYTITAKNIAGTATVALTITVIAAAAPSGLSYSTASASYWQNVAITEDTAQLATGVADSFTLSTALPAGLSLNKTTGAITGTPTILQSATAYTVTAQNGGGTATASITIVVNGPPSGLAYAVNPATYWLGVVIAMDSATLTGVADSFSASPALPSGLSLNATTGSITGMPGASQAASAYTVTAWNPAGSASVSLSIMVNGPPATPMLALPADNANTVSTTPKLSWSTAASATSYRVQLSTSASFGPAIVDSSLSNTSDSIVTALSGRVQYYWRVAATNPAGSSAWNTDSFTIMMYIAIPVRAGWNFVSLNVHAQDILAADVMGTLKGFVLAKTLTQVYWPYYGISGIDTMQVIRGYEMYSDSADTIKAAGPAVNVPATPISLSGGWNLISYLPQAPMSVDSAIAAVDSQIVLVKDQDGYVYWPAEELNGIGDMNPGQGYQVYMSMSGVLTYPVASGYAKRFAIGVRKSVALPRPKHFACGLNTGSNATVLSKRTTINGTTAHDSCEVGVYDSKGNLVGAGAVVHGAAAFSVWGKSGLKKGATAGCDASEKLTFRLWDGAHEYPLEFHGATAPQYANNAILSGTLVVPSGLFITKFALMDAYPNPFRNNIRIAFDVPAAAGNGLQEAEVDVFDIKGSLVAQLAKGGFKAGHYSVSWDGGDASGLGSNMYIVEMKANNFEKMLRLFRVK